MSKLKEYREKKKLTIEEASEKLKIRKQYIIAMEEDRWDDIPGLVYRDGYLKMYCKFLEIPYSESLESEAEEIMPEKSGYNINLKPKLNIVLGFILILTIFVWYFVYNNLHNDDKITRHLENVDHNNVVLDQKTNTNIELKQ